jgi:hypothetical protein
MKERPIILSAPMVRAILEGRKTQFRRVVKPQPNGGPGAQMVYLGGEWGLLDGEGEWRCPYGHPGDRLWVRESHWRFTGCADNGKPWPGFVESPDGNPYNARCHDDYAEMQALLMACAAVRIQSIHMPRWASRITLEVTGVRVERLKDISEKDAEAEGCPLDRLLARDWYSELWESINGPGSWSANPWVWVVEFTRAAQAKEGAE